MVGILDFCSPICNHPSIELGCIVVLNAEMWRACAKLLHKCLGNSSSDEEDSEFSE